MAHTPQCSWVGDHPTGKSPPFTSEKDRGCRVKAFRQTVGVTHKFRERLREHIGAEDRSRQRPQRTSEFGRIFPILPNKTGFSVRGDAPKVHSKRSRSQVAR
jgi:hypothetical protein